jgi:methionyl-tRNA formyltransferase
VKIVFLGTPDFAVPSLRALHEAGHEIVGAFCQPDRPRGRNMRLCACAVKCAAEELGIPVIQVESIRKQEGLDALRALKPDLCVTAAFGQILSAKNLAVPPLGTVNVHASLLPKYRGAAPIQAAIIAGERKTGVTTMYTDIGVDTGDMILQREIEIGEDETAGELFERLAQLGARAIVKTVALIEKGIAPRVPQDESLASHCKMIRKEDAFIDFTKSAREVNNLIRGMNPWPIAYALADEQPLKIYSAQVVERSGLPGELLCKSPRDGLVIACGEGAISAEIFQIPGGRPMQAHEYLCGHTIKSRFLGGRNG